MITVIIAGGSGTRLWPLSTPEYPKHLLKLTGERTLLQTAYDRATRLGDIIYVVTEASHSDHVREQLPELPDNAFLIEPGRRGTAHCIVFALDVIARHHDHDEPVAFIHSDHYVRDVDGFANSFAVAARISQQNQEITLIGIEPTMPSTGFGYIERDGVIDADSGVYHVESFKEKPDFETAQKYVDSGRYLWNCGYFVGSVDTFLQELDRSAPELRASFDSLAAVSEPGTDEYNEAYLALDNQVIDIALIEKAKSLAVVSASFDWMDVGSFKDLHDAVQRDEQGNYFRGENIYPIDVENVFVRNEEAKPIAVIGLDNVVVVNTPQGILVARTDVSHRTGEVAKKLQS
ncbi:MAG TPA: sugar phosphate nucleotidyltransferase [Candidatus Saccharimonadales bacterium]|nr:sugar phosphate nucleotidyltransferase [Candidatus Saccharimonadales bacterium]